MSIESFYINKIITGGFDDEAHRYLVKYSKGEFPGPDLLIKHKGDKLNIWADYEYATFLQIFFIDEIQQDSLKVKGRIYSIRDIKEDLKGLTPCSVKRSPPLYAADLDGIYSKRSLLNALSSKDVASALLNINLQGGLYSSIKTKSKIPKPRIEKSMSPPSFIVMKLDVKECRDPKPVLLKILVPDLPQEKSGSETVEVETVFSIRELVFPENKDKLPPAQLRQTVRRSGVLRRKIRVDDSLIEKEFPF